MERSGPFRCHPTKPWPTRRSSGCRITPSARKPDLDPFRRPSSTAIGMSMPEPRNRCQQSAPPDRSVRWSSPAPHVRSEPPHQPWIVVTVPLASSRAPPSSRAQPALSGCETRIHLATGVIAGARSALTQEQSCGPGESLRRYPGRPSHQLVGHPSAGHGFFTVSVPGMSVPQVGWDDVGTKPRFCARRIQTHCSGGSWPKIVA